MKCRPSAFSAAPIPRPPAGSEMEVRRGKGAVAVGVEQFGVQFVLCDPWLRYSGELVTGHAAGEERT